MEENMIEFEVQNFTGHRCLNGESRKGEQIEVAMPDPSGTTRFIRTQEEVFGLEYSNSIRRQFTNSCSLTIFPNGNKPENEDYVSIAFDIAVCNLERKDNLDEWKRYRDETIALVCVTSLVDKDRNFRFSQSFELNLERRPLQRLLPAEMERFVRRRVLLDASEELLPGDRLKMRCDVVNFFSVKYCEEQSYVNLDHNLHVVARRESWYTRTENGSFALDLRNANSPMCSRLRKQSDFFRALFQSPLKETKDGYMPIEEFEYHAFVNMLGYIRFGNVRHIREYYEFEDVYELACIYGVRDLEEICIAYFKKNLMFGNAILTLRIADSRGDVELRELAFEEALANWEYVLSSEDWKDLCSEWPQLANELSCAALNMNSEASVRNIAAGPILPKRNKVQYSSDWLNVFEVLQGKKRFVSKFRPRKGTPPKKCEDLTPHYDFYR